MKTFYYNAGMGCIYRGLSEEAATKWRGIAPEKEVAEDNPASLIQLYHGLVTVDEFCQLHMAKPRKHLAVEVGGKRARAEYSAMRRRLKRILEAANRRGETVSAPIGTTYHPRHPFDEVDGLQCALWGIKDNRIQWVLVLRSRANDSEYSAKWCGMEHGYFRTADQLLRAAANDVNKSLNLQ